MLLYIRLRDGGNVQIADLAKIEIVKAEFVKVDPSETTSIKLIDDATYIFEGDKKVILQGKDILYIEVN